MRTLIEKGASLDAVDKEHGWTPLDWAVHKCSEEAAAVLRTHGARHSLLFAADKGMTDEVAACIAAGQDINACDDCDSTALH